MSLAASLGLIQPDAWSVTVRRSWWRPAVEMLFYDKAQAEAAGGKVTPLVTADLADDEDEEPGPFNGGPFGQREVRDGFGVGGGPWAR